jgi:hypothetical protein
LSPDTTIVLEVYCVESVASVTLLKLNASGVISALRVVTVKFAWTQPISRVAELSVLLLPVVVSRTQTVSLRLTIQALEVKDPPLILYSPHETVTFAAVFMPVTAIELETYCVRRSASVTLFNVNTSGLVSGIGGGPEPSGASSLYG